MAKKRVLVVVDYQKDFVDGALGFESAKNLDEGIAALMKEYAEDENGIIICTFDTHDKNYLETQEGRKLPVRHCERHSDGWSLYGKTGEYVQNLTDEYASDKYIGNNGYEGSAGDCILDACVDKDIYFVEKPTFPSLKLGELLNNIDKHSEIETITLVGVVTNMCVISNAVIAKAACPEAEIIIKKDLVDSFDKELHQKALDVMASMQMTIE